MILVLQLHNSANNRFVWNKKIYYGFKDLTRKKYTVSCGKSRAFF